MRKSKVETAETRERIIKSATSEFKQRGIVATGLADLMSAAGMTHGGFYRHFDSKEQLVTEACATASSSMLSRLKLLIAQKQGRKSLKALAEFYLSPNHRDNPQSGCALAAIGSELARMDEQTRAVVTESFRCWVEVLKAQYSNSKPSESKKKALVAASTMLGALTLSRIVTDQELSQAILKSACESVANS